MKVRVNLKALKSEGAKIEDELEMEVEENSTVKSLLERLVLTYGDNLAKLIGNSERGFKVLVIKDGEVAKYNQSLKNNDKLSLILPVAGG